MAELTRDTVLVALRDHIGEGRGVRAVDLCREIVGASVSAHDLRALRKLIQMLRTEGQHICGTPDQHGYYLAATPEELERTCAFLTDRAMTSLTQVSAMKRVSVPDLVGQLRLPT